MPGLNGNITAEALLSFLLPLGFWVLIPYLKILKVCRGLSPLNKKNTETSYTKHMLLPQTHGVKNSCQHWQKLIHPMLNLFTASVSSHWILMSTQAVWTFEFPIHLTRQKWKVHFRNSIRAMWHFYQMAAPRREPWSRFLSSLDKRNTGKSLRECCPSGCTLDSWPTSPPGGTTSVFSKIMLEQPFLICYTLIPAIPPLAL